MIDSKMRYAVCSMGVWVPSPTQYVTMSLEAMYYIFVVHKEINIITVTS